MVVLHSVGVMPRTKNLSPVGSALRPFFKLRVPLAVVDLCHSFVLVSRMNRSHDQTYLMNCKTVLTCLDEAATD
eukprot:g63513.t1